MATSDHCLFLLNLWRSSGGSVRGLPFLLWALDRQVTFVSPSLGLLAPDGGRVSSFPFQGQDAAATVKKCWALCPQIGCDLTCWFRELGGWSKGRYFHFVLWVLGLFSASSFPGEFVAGFVQFRVFNNESSSCPVCWDESHWLQHWVSEFRDDPWLVRVSTCAWEHLIGMF